MAQLDILPPQQGVLRFRARFAREARDLDGALALRAQLFRGGQRSDEDRFDAVCRHVLVEDEHRQPVCCLRFLEFASGADIARSYSAQHYDLDGLLSFDAPMIELGRFCVDPTQRDPAILRTVWAFLADHVAQHKTQLLFGCSSFPGISAQPYLDSFAMLKQRHLGPKRLMPGVKARDIVPFPSMPPGRTLDQMAGLRAMPALVRSYLSMGGWVGDHAVVDRDLGTLHVFTGLETARIPPARKRFLQAKDMPREMKPG